jgi:hypothetical protein
VASALNQLGSYDIIAAWQVIEHLPQFTEILHLAAEHLHPDGILVLSAPNPDALQFSIFKRFWANLDAPRHLQLVPRSLLVKLLREHNLQLVYASTCDEEGQQLENFGWIKSIMNRLNVYVAPLQFEQNTSKVVGNRASFKYRMARSSLRALVALLNLVTKPYICSRFKGSSYTLVFQKQP